MVYQVKCVLSCTRLLNTKIEQPKSEQTLSHTNVLDVAVSVTFTACYRQVMTTARCKLIMTSQF